MGEDLRAGGVEVVVGLTTHWQPEDAFLVDDLPEHRTLVDYRGFRVVIRYDCPGDPELAGSLVDAGRAAGLVVRTEARGADHALHVPLHFIAPQTDLPVIPCSVSRRPLEDCLTWGRALLAGIEASGRRSALLATGALSHNLWAFVRGVEWEAFGEFDQALLGLLQNGRGLEAPSLDRKLVAMAQPEGEFRDLYILLGAVGPATVAEVLAYEELPGVGMAVVRF